MDLPAQQLANQGTSSAYSNNYSGENFQMTKQQKAEEEKNEQQMTPRYLNDRMKTFKIKFCFKNALEAKNRALISDSDEDHFGRQWRIIMSLAEKNFSCFPVCCEPLVVDKVHFDFEYAMMFQVERKSSKWFGSTFEADSSKEWDPCLTSANIVKHCLSDGSLTIECYIRIKKYKGAYKNNLRDFGKKAKASSDVALLVDEQKFFVSSQILSADSSYFNALLMGSFAESTMSEVKIDGIDADDFQNFLEILYGHPAIDNRTVEGILHIAHMLDTQIVVQKCVEFLLSLKSKKTSKKMFSLAVKYMLNDLKTEVLARIHTQDELDTIQSVDYYDRDSCNLLMSKSVSLMSLCSLWPCVRKKICVK
uniref:BTB domain-containing protein n=1 Tax=Caenorhabditis tropicalis TaxID=1561998 RepID=A0A1I7ULJ7_9PELO